jgi:hypothetical protein
VQGDHTRYCSFPEKFIVLRSDLKTTADAFVVQPSLAAQLGMKQVVKRPESQLHSRQEQDDFDDLDLED